MSSYSLDDQICMWVQTCKHHAWSKIGIAELQVAMAGQLGSRWNLALSKFVPWGDGICRTFQTCNPRFSYNTGILEAQAFQEKPYLWTDLLTALALMGNLLPQIQAGRGYMMDARYQRMHPLEL